MLFQGKQSQSQENTCNELERTGMKGRLKEYKNKKRERARERKRVKERERERERETTIEK